MTGMIFDINDVELADFMGSQESQFIDTVPAFADKTRERLRYGVTQYGDELPWSKTHTIVRLRPGEVSIVAGVNGTGKSELLGMIFLWLASSSRVTIASLEMKPEATLERMVRQAAGTDRPTDRFFDAFVKWGTDRVWIYDQQDTLPPDRILAMVHFSAVNLQCKHISIDSLMMCGMAPDDYPAQKNFMGRLIMAAKRYDIHISLVHHMRKGEREEHIPDKFSVKGAGELVDMADNLFIIHRNKRKERMEDQGEDVEGMPDTIMRVAKQRHGEWEGDVLLWHDRPSKQFIAKEGSLMPWPDPATYAGFIEEWS